MPAFAGKAAPGGPDRGLGEIPQHNETKFQLNPSVLIATFGSFHVFFKKNELKTRRFSSH